MVVDVDVYGVCFVVDIEVERLFGVLRVWIGGVRIWWVVGVLWVN